MEGGETRKHDEGRQDGGKARGDTTQESHHRDGADRPRRVLSESEGFRMASTVESGVADSWNKSDPLAPSLGCPSSPRVFQIGIAMDAGYFKVNWVFLQAICVSVSSD